MTTAKKPVAASPAANSQPAAQVAQATKASADKARNVSAQTTESLLQGSQSFWNACVSMLENLSSHTSSSLKNQSKEASTTMIQNYEQFQQQLNEVQSLIKNQMEASIQAANIMVQNMEAINKACFSYCQKTFESNLSACKAMTGCKNAQEALDIQSNLAKSNMDSFISESTKLSQQTFDAANKAFQPIQNSINKAVDTAIKKAA